MAHPPTQSYLLRLWREHATAPLRASLTPVSQPDEQRHFADLDALLRFLRAQEDGPTIANDEQFTA